MSKVKLSRYVAAVFLVGLLAVAGFVLSHPKHAMADPPDGFTLDDVEGRYISADVGADISSVHDAGGGNVGSPIWFSETSVMVADGKGAVCGESDLFYGGFPPPGDNEGPGFFHGTYTVDANGRITINTCQDTNNPVAICTDFSACDLTGKTEVIRTLVGYLQKHDAKKFTTVDYINNSDASKGGCCASSGFLVRARTWTKGTRGEEEH